MACWWQHNRYQLEQGHIPIAKIVHEQNTTNLRYVIAATGQVILLQLDSNRQFFGPYYLDIWRTSSKNSKAPLLSTPIFAPLFKAIGKFKLHLQSGYAKFESKLPMFCPMWASNLWMTLKTNRAPFLTISEFKLQLQSRNAQVVSKLAICCVARDLEIWQMTLKHNRAPFLCYFKLCTSFHNHQWIQTGVTVWKAPIRFKLDNLCVPRDLEI